MQNHVGNSKTDNNQLNFILLGQSKVANGRIDMWGIYAGTSIADVFILKRLILFGSSEIT